MGSESFHLLEKLVLDSKLTLFNYIGNRVEYARFFSYGSNMNKEKFKADMEKAANSLKLDLPEKNHLELDKFAIKRLLPNFKRELSNESHTHGLAFSICPSSNSSVCGICHDIAVSALPAFLKKEGLFSRESVPSYKLIRVGVLGEEKEVLTLLGLKPKPIEHLKYENKIDAAIRYLEDSIKGAEFFGVEHADMIEVKRQIATLK